MFWNTSKKNKEQHENYIQKVTELEEQFHKELADIRSVAQSSLQEWKTYLETLSITPVSDAQRKQAQTSGLPIPKIAFPSEYRAALVVFDEKTQGLVEGLEDEIETAGAEEAATMLEDFIDKYLHEMIESELKKYLDASKPKVSVSDIFANASTSLNKYSTKETGDKSYSIKCPSCGAARLEEDQDECFYCGTPLFPN